MSGGRSIFMAYRESLGCDGVGAYAFRESSWSRNPTIESTRNQGCSEVPASPAWRRWSSSNIDTGPRSRMRQSTSYWRQAACRSLHAHQTEDTDQPGSLYG